MNKASIRTTLMKQRANLPPDFVSQQSDNVHTQLLNFSVFNQASTLFIYMDFKNEVQTLKIIEEALIHGKEIVLPRIDIRTQRLKVFSITTLADLEKNHFGILEPGKSASPWPVESPLELVLTPGVAFDKTGNRLGFGKGYYDLFFATLPYAPTKIGLAYDFQIAPEVPSERHDIKMNYIVTPSEIIKCS